MNIYHITLIVISAFLDIGANLLLHKSRGFSVKSYGIFALCLICLAFTLLAEVAKSVNLAIAYTAWGAIAVIGTAILGRIFYGQKLNKKGFLGIILIIASLALLKIE